MTIIIVTIIMIMIIMIIQNNEKSNLTISHNDITFACNKSNGLFCHIVLVGGKKGFNRSRDIMEQSYG